MVWSLCVQGRLPGRQLVRGQSSSELTPARTGSTNSLLCIRWNKREFSLNPSNFGSSTQSPPSGHDRIAVLNIGSGELITTRVRIAGRRHLDGARRALAGSPRLAAPNLSTRPAASTCTPRARQELLFTPALRSRAWSVHCCAADCSASQGEPKGGV